MELKIIQISLGTVLETSAAMIAEMAQNKGLELVCSPVLELFQSNYLGDPARVPQVITNLCITSIKFTAWGYIEISAEIIAHDTHQVTARIAIQDTGIGLDVSVQKEILNFFSQADSSTTRRYGRTGLGLSICKHLVELMGGEIVVISKKGQGSTFWFTIKMPTTAACSAVEEHTGEEPKVRAKRLLVVTESTARGASLARRIDAEQ